MASICFRTYATSTTCSRFVSEVFSASCACPTNPPGFPSNGIVINSLSDIFLSSKLSSGGHARHILFSEMKRALPFFTSPLARLGQVTPYSFPCSSTTIMFFAMGIPPLAIENNFYVNTVLYYGCLPLFTNSVYRIYQKKSILPDKFYTKGTPSLSPQSTCPCQV